MLKSIGRAAGAVIQLLIPEAEAQACTPGWCERNASGQGRCCKICTGGTKVCTRWGFGCPNSCDNY
jgi:hypothetical protein